MRVQQDTITHVIMCMHQEIKPEVFTLVKIKILLLSPYFAPIMKSASSSETLVTIYKPRWCHTPKDHNLIYHILFSLI